MCRRPQKLALTPFRAMKAHVAQEGESASGTRDDFVIGYRILLTDGYAANPPPDT